LKKLIAISTWVAMIIAAVLLYFQGSYINYIIQDVALFLDQYREVPRPNYTYEQMVTEHRSFSPYITGKLDILKEVVYIQAALLIILSVFFVLSYRRKAQP
jgi:hypothetical protein